MRDGILNVPIGGDVMLKESDVGAADCKTVESLMARKVANKPAPPARLKPHEENNLLYFMMAY
jgi:hypothetical protein